MDIIEYLNQNRLLNIPFIEALESGEATLINFDSDGAAAIHNGEDILYLSLTSDEALKKYHGLINQKVSIILGAMDLNKIASFFPGFRQVPCYQVVYTKKEPPVLNGKAEFKLLDESYGEFVLETYSNKSFTLESIKKLLLRKLIFGIFVDGTLAGYCGRHREGAMGLLEIMPRFRRQGLGLECEKFVISEVLKEGKTPYGHVVIDNEISMNLQKRIPGTEFADKIVLWHVLSKKI